MNLELVEVEDGTMPKGHDWAVVKLPEHVVLLVRESVMQQSGMDSGNLNEALRRAG